MAEETANIANGKRSVTVQDREVLLENRDRKVTQTHLFRSAFEVFCGDALLSLATYTVGQVHRKHHEPPEILLGGNAVAIAGRERCSVTPRGSHRVQSELVAP